MSKTVKLLLVAGLSMSLLLTGCSKNDEEHEVATLQQQVQDLKDENKELLEENKALEKQIDELTNQVEEEPEEEEKESYHYTVYTSNIDTLEKEPIAEVEIQEEMTLEEKLQVLADTLSKEKFSGLPIEIEEIKTIDGKKIAIINLEEDESIEEGWMSLYFQGSTGGGVTANSIKETFLQPDMPNEVEWIDGIKVLYEGEAPEMDHMIILGEVIYR